MGLVYTKQEFLQQFNFQKHTSFADFSTQLSVLNGSDRSGKFVVRATVDDFLAQWATKDNRLDRLDLYKQNLYKMIVQEPEVALSQWYDKTVAIQDLDFYFDFPQTEILQDNIFAGRTNAKYGRLFKNINFDDFYNTKKLYTNDFEYVMGLMQALFENFKIRNSLVGPAFFDHICKIENSDYNQFWSDFMMGCNKASIFNPFTYRGILDSIFEGDTVFAPVMGWNSYQLGFYNSKFSHMITTDVIPNVANNSELLHEQYLDYYARTPRLNLWEDSKTVDSYLCPSEQLQAKHDFVNRYQNSVDAVLFSPPYFDLELYPGEMQSTASFPDYQDWLEGYWAETVMLCEKVMRKGARFGFVISNYRNKDKEDNTISQDMKQVVDRYLKPLQHYRVEWSSIGGSRQAHKQRDGNFEDLWLYEKG